MELIKKYWWILAAAVIFIMMGKKKKTTRRRRSVNRMGQMAMRGSRYMRMGRTRRSLIPTRGRTRRRYSGRMRRR